MRITLPEESATTAVFYPQYNEATIEKSEDTVSKPIQDSDFNDPSVCSTNAHCFFIDSGGMGHLNIVTHAFPMEMNNKIMYNFVIFFFPKIFT